MTGRGLSNQGRSCQYSRAAATQSGNGIRSAPKDAFELLRTCRAPVQPISESGCEIRRGANRVALPIGTVSLGTCKIGRTQIGSKAGSTSLRAPKISGGTRAHWMAAMAAFATRKQPGQVQHSTINHRPRSCQSPLRPQSGDALVCAD